MKKIIEFLEKNGIEYKLVTCGNPYYYNDGFTVPAISIRFDYESIDCSCIPEMQKKESFLSLWNGERIIVLALLVKAVFISAGI